MPAELPKVGLHVNAFPIPSEAFIVEQARSLTRHAPVILARRSIGASSLEVRAIQTAEGGALRRRAFAVAPGPWAWGGQAALRDLSLLHAHFGQNGVPAGALATRLDIPYVVTFHGNDVTVRTSALVRSQGLAGIAYAAGFGRMVRRASRLVAVSDFVARRLVQLGAPEDRIERHYIGVDVDRFHPVAPAARSRDIVCVARLVEAKGVGDLIRAFDRVAGDFPETRLRLIGAGADEQALRALARATTCADRIVFEGALPHAAVADIVRHGAVAVLASRTGADGWQEAFGLASIEAAACGLPVVVSDNGGLPETVVHGETGWVTPEAQPDRLADCLRTLLGDDALRERLGQAGRRRILRDFDLRACTARLEQMYERVRHAS